MSKTQYTDAEGWLSRNGNMFRGGHCDVAFRFFSHRDDPHSAMDEAGWWRLRTQNLRAPKWVGYLPATDEQRRYILRWVRERKRLAPRSLQAEAPLFCGVSAEMDRARRFLP